MYAVVFAIFRTSVLFRLQSKLESTTTVQGRYIVHTDATRHIISECTTNVLIFSKDEWNVYCKKS